MPTVSVVIPTYERADVLPRAMDSALDQTVADLELVVVDDGSTDDTEAVVTGYDDDRVEYVAHDTNRGANVARNTGIEVAEGDYVAFLDSDDEWRPTKLERQLDRIEDGDWVAAYCDFETRPGGPTARFESAAASVLARADDPRPREGGTELVGEILADHLHPGAGSTLVVDADVARGVGGFDESLDRFQDPEFVLRILGEGRLAYVDEPLVVRHDTGVPAAATVAAADRQYLAKHADAVARAEDEGFDVRERHNLVLAKHFFAEGGLASGLHHLAHASVDPRHAPGLAWTVGAGVRRRTGRRSELVAFTVLAAAATALLARRR